MRAKHAVPLVLLVLLAASIRAQQRPTVDIPQSGVPQIMTIEGEFVRAAYNNEGYVIIGYRLANESLGQEWILLETGMTLRKGVPYYKLAPSAISLEIPEGKTIPMATNQEMQRANLAALQTRQRAIRDSINYFPPNAYQPCRIGFFAELNERAVAYDTVELSDTRACVGRLYFHVPGGIKHGQHWLNVKFEKSVVRVPFRILTDEEEKLLSKNYRDIRRQVQEAFKN